MMQKYIVFHQTTIATKNAHGGLTMTTKGDNWKRYTFNAQNINNLRAKIIRELFKGKPGECEVYKIVGKKDGKEVGHNLGRMNHYTDEGVHAGYTWIPYTEGNFSVGTPVIPKTGRLLYDN